MEQMAAWKWLKVVKEDLGNAKKLFPNHGGVLQGSWELILN